MSSGEMESPFALTSPFCSQPTTHPLVCESVQSVARLMCFHRIGKITSGPRTADVDGATLADSRAVQQDRI